MINIETNWTNLGLLVGLEHPREDVGECVALIQPCELVVRQLEVIRLAVVLLI